MEERTSEEQHMHALVVTEIQRNCLKSMEFVTDNYHKLTAALLEEDKEGTASLVGLVSGSISRLKAFEFLLLKFILEFTRDEEAPKNTFLFLKEQTEEITAILMLVNGLITPQELRDLYRPENVEKVISMSESAVAEGCVTHTKVEDALSDLKTMLEKIEGNKKEDGVTPEG